MLRRPSSRAPWPAGSESHPCARCGTLTAGIAVGGRCAACVQAVARKASYIGRLVAVATTLLLAVYLVLTLGRVPAAWQGTARAVGGVAAVTWYLLTYRIVKRIALEWLK